MQPTKSIALVAHDARKDDMVDWASRHVEDLANLKIYATGTTGQRLIDGTSQCLDTLGLNAALKVQVKFHLGQHFDGRALTLAQVHRGH